MTEQFLKLKEGFTSHELPGGILSVDASHGYMVVGPEFTYLDDPGCADYAFGDSLNEAQANYWQRKAENGGSLLVDLTRKVSELGSEVKTRREAWESANAELLQDHSIASTNLAALESDLKTASVRLFELTGDKAPSEFTIVKEKDGGLEYDPKKALEWCRENMKAAVLEVLDVKAFESYSKVDELDFVTKRGKIPTAQIARTKLADRTQ